MATFDTKIPQEEKRVRRTEVTRLFEVAETIRDDALVWARSGLGILDRGHELEDLFELPRFVDRFKYGLAKGVADTIAANDQRVQAIYVFDTELSSDLQTGCELPIEVSVHQLALVSSPSAALESFIISLDRALIDSLQELPVRLYKECRWILDVKLITEYDVDNKIGYACLLGSTHSPALEIWKRTT
jgi:hypothetical protein